MKLENRTHWNGEHLRAFALRVASEELDASQRARTSVRIEYTRGGRGSSGRAWASVHHATVRVPRNRPDKADLAMVFAHEFAHLRGLGHAAMRGSPRYGRVGNWRTRYAWAETLPLEPDPAKLDFRCEFYRCGRVARHRVGAEAGAGAGEFRCRRHTPTPATAPRLPDRVIVRETLSDRRAKLERKVAQWTRKRKTADTFLKKWIRRLRALESRERVAATRLDSLPE